MAREKQPAWESTSSTGEEWLDTVGRLCHPVWKRATMVYPANTERSKFDIAKALEDVFLAGGVWGGLGLTYPSQAKPDTG